MDETERVVPESNISNLFTFNEAIFNKFMNAGNAQDEFALVQHEVVNVPSARINKRGSVLIDFLFHFLRYRSIKHLPCAFRIPLLYADLFICLS